MSWAEATRDGEHSTNEAQGAALRGLPGRLGGGRRPEFKLFAGPNPQPSSRKVPVLSARILLVEDDRVLADGLTSVLGSVGLSCEVVALGEAADAELQRRSSFDLLLLDIGFAGYRWLRAAAPAAARPQRSCRRSFSLPAIRISDLVHGFDLGADDYVVEPFAIDELLARVRSLLRRHPARATRLTHGPLTMDLNARRAFNGDQPIELSVREWSVLEHLMKNVEKVVNKKRELTEAVRGGYLAHAQCRRGLYLAAAEQA